MGGKTWRREEETLFWTVLIPLSPEGLEEGKQNTYSWQKCADEMRARLGHLEYRNYNKQLLYEHFYQNCHSSRPSPCAKSYVKEYMKARGGRPIEHPRRGVIMETSQGDTPPPASNRRPPPPDARPAPADPQADPAPRLPDPTTSVYFTQRHALQREDPIHFGPRLSAVRPPAPESGYHHGENGGYEQQQPVPGGYGQHQQPPAQYSGYGTLPVQYSDYHKLPAHYQNPSEHQHYQQHHGYHAAAPNDAPSPHASASSGPSSRSHSVFDSARTSAHGTEATTPSPRMDGERERGV